MTHINDAPRCTPRSVTIVALLTAACLAGDSMLYIVLPTHWEAAGLDSLWEVGILLSVNRFVRLPLTPFAGWAFTRIGVRTGILTAVILAVILTVGYGFAQNFAVWVVLRCLWGLVWTFLKLGAFLMILECSDDTNRGARFGRYNGLFRLGSLAGMLFGGVIGDLWGLPAAAFLFAGLALIAVPFTPWHVPNVRVAHRETESLRKRLAVAKAPAVFRALITGAVVALVYQGVLASSISQLIRTSFGQVVDVGILAVGAASLAGVMQAMRWAWEPWLAPWFGHLSDGPQGRHHVLIMSLIAGSLVFAVLPMISSILVWIFIVIGVQITATSLTTLADSVTGDVAGTSRTAVMTVYLMFQDAGSALGPFLGYLLAAKFGTGSMYYGASILLAMTAIWWWTDRTKHNVKLPDNP